MNQEQKRLFDTDPAPWDLDEAEEKCVATVVFSEPPFGPFDYLVPTRLQGRIEAGRRLQAPLGRGNRVVTAYCVSVEFRPTTRRLKEIRTVIDDAALLSPAMLRLTSWIAEQYLCPWGKAIEAVVPAGVRGQAGSREMTFLSVPRNVAAKLTTLKLPPKQQEALERLAASTRAMTPAELADAAHCTMGPIAALRKKGLVDAEVRRVQQGDHEIPSEPPGEKLTLNPAQQAALDAIRRTLDSAKHETLLVHGVTGSGKTEIYIRAIEEVIRFGRQAIVLVPEISLTPQTRQRFRSRFQSVAVLHSRLTPSERHWHWQRIAEGKIEVIVGARSAIFAPTPNLGLIVLDEEHDASFKQDSEPRYHAREVALRRAQEEQIPLVLGSATPALESWQRALSGQFRRIDLPLRVADRPFPLTEAIDLRAEFTHQGSRGAISRPLHNAMRTALEDEGQIILLLNRRGFSTNIQCPACGHVVKCDQCDIALTHHRDGDQAICHYCDYRIPPPPSCPECQFAGIRYGGLGTQRLETEVKARFPDTSCVRMDSDSMQKPGSHEKALASFRAGDVRILLGTQMIAKGLDFPNVTLVGVINADTSLHLPDFRAAERTFQLVTQVAGRTGRGARAGRVLVQTFSPEHPAIQAALQHDYYRFAAGELPIRKEFGYPPFEQVIRLIVRGPIEEQTEQFADLITDRMRARIEDQQFDARVMGPAPAPISRLRGKFRYHALLQGPSGDQLRDVARHAAIDLPVIDELQWIFDVDPTSLL
ncbi:replication restart helicase PriA [Lignipirellula cremea]|nr:primosomal protein N' [Lignipirellula cremea]